MVKGHQQTETPTPTFWGQESSFLNLFKAKGNGGFSKYGAIIPHPRIHHLPLPDRPRAECIQVLGMSQDLKESIL